MVEIGRASKHMQHTQLLTYFSHAGVQGVTRDYKVHQVSIGFNSVQRSAREVIYVVRGVRGSKGD